MFRRLALCIPLLVGIGLATAGDAQRRPFYESAAESRAALEKALADQRLAARRSQQLEVEAARAVETAEKTARETAALAARIQEAEAGIAAAEARIALIDGERVQLRRRLAEREKPVVRLTAALQKFSRRPVGLAVLRPGSVRDMVHLRAVLGTAVPEMQRRTADLRAEIERGRALQREAEQAASTLRASESELAARHETLAELETRQRLASQRKSGEADREAERALALAEQARDLDALVGELDRAAGLRADLAALPGPLLRPPRPEESQVLIQNAPEQAEAPIVPPAGYRLPVSGRTVGGFGVPTEGGALSQGITLVPRPGALVVAPAAGRVVFAGAYRGYGRIVILEHEGGWTSLVTGLAREDVSVGEQLVTGSPLGVASPADPLVTLELRHDGEPVNPLAFLS